MADFTLYIGEKNYSSWSLRGWLPLAHSGADFIEVPLALDTPSFYTAFDGISSVKKVPLLVHHLDSGDVVVWDSLAIADYIARHYPDAGLWPRDVRAFACAKSITAEMHSGFTALRAACPMNIRGIFEPKKFGPETLSDFQRFDELVQDARARFGASGDFMFGAEPTIADFFYAPIASRCETYHAPISDVTRAWVDAIFAHPLMVKWCENAVAETSVVVADEIDLTAKVLGQ